MPLPAPTGWTALNVNISGNAQRLTAFVQFKKAGTTTTYPTAVVQIQSSHVTCGADFLAGGAVQTTWPVNVNTFVVQLTGDGGLVGPVSVTLTLLVQGIQPDDIFSVMIPNSPTYPGSTKGVTVLAQEWTSNSAPTTLVLSVDLSSYGAGVWLDFALPLT